MDALVRLEKAIVFVCSLFLAGAFCAIVVSMLKPTLMMILFAWIPTLVLTTYIPDVALWLPNLVYGR